MTEPAAPVYRYEPDVVLPPGETLLEVLEERGMKQSDLAARTGLSTKHINQVVKGAAPITPATALLFEDATGVRARVWSNLEIAYRAQESRREQAARREGELDWLDELPVNELINRGWIDKGLAPVERLQAVCRFFGVASRSAWNAVWDKPTAYRFTQAFTSDPGAVAAWIRIGEIKAAEIDCAPFDKSGLQQILADLRALTLEPDQHLWRPALVRRCAEVGIAVVVEPEIKKARINGVARWLTPDKALIQLSLRHRWSDIVWFTLFHEIGHLLRHSKKEMYINDDGPPSSVEQEADAFAAQLLIPRSAEPELGQLSSEGDVRAFAANIGIAPGIVVGRLQHDKRWPHSRGNSLRQRLEFPW